MASGLQHHSSAGRKYFQRDKEKGIMVVLLFLRSVFSDLGCSSVVQKLPQSRLSAQKQIGNTSRVLFMALED